MTMITGYKTLKYLKKNPKIYEKINSLGDLARAELSKLFKELKIDVEITGIGSLFMIHFLNDKIKKINNASDVTLSNTELLLNYNLEFNCKI